MFCDTKGTKETNAIDCISGNIIEFKDIQGNISCFEKVESNGGDLPFIGPGLVDIQVNGVQGVDFNDISLNEKQIENAALYLLSKGVTAFYPTVITNSPKTIRKLLSVIDNACKTNPLINQCIGGIHLEGPFISGHEGYRGAHNKRYVMAPDWDLFQSFRESSGDRIRIISLSPEYDNSTGFIEKCKKEGLVVGIAHSHADTGQIAAAVKAGASLSTHIGNSVPVKLPRHPNIIWDQLAEDNLYTSIVADGFHLPEPFIKVVLKIKREKAILISDATLFSGLAPGVYKTHIGKEVVVERGGRLSMKGKNGLLAGATKLLPENVQYMVAGNLTDLGTAWYMASVGPLKALGISEIEIEKYRNSNQVVFKMKNGRIEVQEVCKDGKSVWSPEY